MNPLREKDEFVYFLPTLALVSKVKEHCVNRDRQGWKQEEQMEQGGSGNSSDNKSYSPDPQE